MKRINVNLKPCMPIDRRKAALIAQAASRFDATITFEREGVILNAKSMLGMLSQSMPKDGEMALIAEGTDEVKAIEELSGVIESLHTGG